MIGNTQREDLARLTSSFPLSQELRGKVVVVTGATGLIGSSLVRALSGLGARPVAVVRDMAKARRVLGDLAVDVSEGLDAYSGDVDYVVHTACPTASAAFRDTPVEVIGAVVGQTDAALRFARERGARGFVLLSSLEVYGTVSDESRTVDEAFQGYIDPRDTRSCYPLAKRTAECLVASYRREYGLRAMAVRLTQTFGAGVAADDRRVFAQLARSVVRGEDIVLHTEGTLSRPYLYLTDAVSAILFVLLRGEAGEIYNAANDKTYTSVRHMADMLAKEFGPASRVRVELRDNMGYMPPTLLRLTSAKLEALGWHPQYDLREMFARLIASMRETPSRPALPNA